MKNNYIFELGDRVKDIVTGFTGVVMSRMEFLTGCSQYGISPTKLDKDGKRVDWEYFDENRLMKTGKGITLKKKNSKEKEIKGADGNYPTNY